MALEVAPPASVPKVTGVESTTWSALAATGTSRMVSVAPDEALPRVMVVVAAAALIELKSSAPPSTVMAVVPVT